MCFVFKNIAFLFHAECIEKRTAVIAVKGMQEKTNVIVWQWLPHNRFGQCKNNVISSARGCWVHYVREASSVAVAHVTYKTACLARNLQSQSVRNLHVSGNPSPTILKLPEAGYCFTSCGVAIPDLLMFERNHSASFNADGCNDRKTNHSTSKSSICSYVAYVHGK